MGSRAAKPDPWLARLANLQAAMPAGRSAFCPANMASRLAKFGGDPKRPEADPNLYMVMSSQGYLRDVGTRPAGPSSSAGAPSTRS